MKRFSSELDLTPEQQIQVKSILDQQREGLQALRTNFRPQLEQVKKEAREKIRQILDPVQQQKFDQLETRWKRKRNAEPSDHSNF